MAQRSSWVQKNTQIQLPKLPIGFNGCVFYGWVVSGLLHFALADVTEALMG